MDSLGSFALLLALPLSLYALTAALLGQWKRKPLLAQSSERAVLATGGLVLVATACLVISLLQDDFRLAYIASHSNQALPLYFKFSALWSGQEGSLLWWSCILAAYTMAVVLLNRRSHQHLMPYAIATLMAVQFFFLLLNNFAANPFRLLGVETPAGMQVFSPPDGGGLNPLLQHPAMVIHPPMLYLGFVGFTVPFAFALSALATRARGEKWIHITRRWTMVTWGFLTIGVLLGGRWAYAVLGWGGYWGWDPVENASLLPWLTGTAFLHSVMMQEKRGMMKVWNMLLIFATFFLCIFATFLTRSGVLSSVHAFAQSAIGPYFAVFITFGLVFSAILLLRRLDFLKSENQLDSLLSRESSFLFNNLILLAACFAVLWGTLFPLISEAVRGVKISVGAPYFNTVMIPIGILLLILTGAGPLLAWRRTSLESLLRNFALPLLFGAALALLSFVLSFFLDFFQGARNPYALMTIFLAFFVLATIAMEFFRGARVLRQKSRLGWPGATLELTRRNTRRYGGYVIHFGVALLFIGFVGNALSTDRQIEMRPGDEFNLRDYRFVLRGLEEAENDNYIASRAKIDVYHGENFLTTMYPERRFYKASQQPTTEVDIRSRLQEDVYLVFAGLAEDSGRAVIHAYINPLVNWVWIGGFVMVLGTLIALLPSKAPRPAKPLRRNLSRAQSREKRVKERDEITV
ncbi:heme lyase CcmF/NrfE family subunit [Acidobacteriia bacterium AH_259_A11_L15]|nr:heme lyase CcmF/NrfE family subunit [Acidobacteriia bacterium AH_259_A11_L15]